MSDPCVLQHTQYYHYNTNGTARCTLCVKAAAQLDELKLWYNNNGPETLWDMGEDKLDETRSRSDLSTDASAQQFAGRMKKN